MPEDSLVLSLSSYNRLPSSYFTSLSTLVLSLRFPLLTVGSLRVERAKRVIEEGRDVTWDED